MSYKDMGITYDNKTGYFYTIGGGCHETIEEALKDIIGWCQFSLEGEGALGNDHLNFMANRDRMMYDHKKKLESDEGYREYYETQSKKYDIPF